MKKVSIITTTYNDSAALRKTIKQVEAQDYPNIEYIIVDGGSTDDTLEVINEAKEIFGEKLVWISEKDKGIYDAINKGLKLCTGDYIGTCFDQFAGNDVISKMVAVMEKEGTDGVHGDLNYMDGEKVVRKWRQGQGNIRSADAVRNPGNAGDNQHPASDAALGGLFPTIATVTASRSRLICRRGPGPFPVSRRRSR